jgi:hypothetical protein
MANELSKKDPTELATLDDFNDVGGTGYENIRPSDILVPRLTIIQKMSPQVDQNKSEFDKHARVGEVYDIGLQERFPEGVEIVVAHVKTVWVEWEKERGSAKPPVAIYEDETILKQAERDDDGWQLFMKNGNPLSETMQFYVINLSTLGRRKSFLPMSSTQLKKGKRLVTLAQAERITENGIEKMPPMFWRSYFLTTVPERNAKGDWMGWKIERGPLVQERPDSKILLKEIKDFREAVLEGRAHGDLGGAEEGAEKAF